MNPDTLRKSCADELLSKAAEVTSLKGFVGLDGFVDDILHVVDKRNNAETFTELQTIERLAKRIEAAKGRSTNIEIVRDRLKLGGNGPILANALTHFGVGVTYLGALGFPHIHEVFEEFAKRAEVHSICESGYTNAMEFDDGKIMLTRTVQLNEINWANIEERFGREKFIAHFQSADLVSFVNWTMIPYMSRIWETLQKDICPSLTGPKRTIFFDLCDPEKRPDDDIREAMELISRFQEHFNVILGLNEKEASEIGRVLGIATQAGSKDSLSKLASEIYEKMDIGTLVVHPVTYALAVDGDGVALVDGPFVPDPVITTGAGDHFNAGFCVGKLLGLDNEKALLTGVSTSGFYVGSGRSPAISDLAGLLRNWPG